MLGKLHLPAEVDTERLFKLKLLLEVLKDVSPCFIVPMVHFSSYFIETSNGGYDV